MAKKKKNKKKPHWLSFRDDLVPWMNKTVFNPNGSAIDYEKLKGCLGPDRSGFGDFLHTDVGKFVYSGKFSGYAPMGNEIYSVALWDACGRIVLEPSEGLIRLLMETDAKVSIDDVQPPFASVFIKLPKDLIYIPEIHTNKMCAATGMYVAWGPIGEQSAQTERVVTADGLTLSDCTSQGRVLTIAPGTVNFPIHDYALRYHSLCWSRPCKETVDDIVKRHLDLLDNDDVTKSTSYVRQVGTIWERMPIDEFMIRIAANLFLYMSCPDADVLKNPDELYTRLADLKKRHVSSTRRKRVRRQIHDGMVPSDTWIVGSSIVIRPRDYTLAPDAPSEGGRKSPKPHWRRGHIRSVRYGKGRSKSKMKWIMPILVRKTAAGESTEVKPYEVRQ